MKVLKYGASRSETKTALRETASHNRAEGRFQLLGFLIVALLTGYSLFYLSLFAILNRVRKDDFTTKIAWRLGNTHTALFLFCFFGVFSFSRSFQSLQNTQTPWIPDSALKIMEYLHDTWKGLVRSFYIVVAPLRITHCWHVLGESTVEICDGIFV